MIVVALLLHFANLRIFLVAIRYWKLSFTGLQIPDQYCDKGTRREKHTNRGSNINPPEFIDLYAEGLSNVALFVEGFSVSNLGRTSLILSSYWENQTLDDSLVMRWFVLMTNWYWHSQYAQGIRPVCISRYPSRVLPAELPLVNTLTQATDAHRIFSKKTK